MGGGGMSLLKDAEALVNENAKKEAERRKGHRDTAIQTITDGVFYAFGEHPDKVEWEHPHGAVATIDGLRFVNTHSSSTGSGTGLHLLVICEDCGVEYVGKYVYAVKNNYGKAQEKPAADRRKAALEHLARALDPSPSFKHTCYEAEIKAIKAAVKNAASRLKTSEADVLYKAGLLL